MLAAHEQGRKVSSLFIWFWNLSSHTCSEQDTDLCSKLKIQHLAKLQCDMKGQETGRNVSKMERKSGGLI
jgi:hypothetical protein